MTRTKSDIEFARYNCRFEAEKMTYLQETAWINHTTVAQILDDLVTEDMKRHPHWKDTIDVLNTEIKQQKNVRTK